MPQKTATVVASDRLTSIFIHPCHIAILSRTVPSSLSLYCLSLWLPFTPVLPFCLYPPRMPISVLITSLVLYSYTHLYTTGISDMFIADYKGIRPTFRYRASFIASGAPIVPTGT